MRKQLLLAVLIVPFLAFQAQGQQTIGNTSNNQSSTYSNITTKSGATIDHSGHNYGSSSVAGEKCLQNSKTEALKASNPEYLQGWLEARETTWRIAAELESGERVAPPVYTIPVVFHIIHKGESIGVGTNISTAQIQSSVDALNRDFRRTNADGGIAQGAGPDTEIQFCLAGVNESGSPHSGINRVDGRVVGGYDGSGITDANELQVKALSNWDNRYFLNIWVVSEIDNNNADLSDPSNWGGGTLGYAYQPVADVTWMADRDGVVAVNLCVGNDPNQSNGYRLWPWGGLTNRTVTHEVGHFLSLDHTFHNTGSCSESNCSTQGDQICDTPVTIQGSDCNSGTCSNSQVENYMDYTSETCQDQFTNGQSTVMRGTLTGARSALVATSNCGSSTDYDAGISSITTPNGALCATTFSPVVTLNNYGSTALTSVQIQYYIDANGPTTYNWSGNLASGSSTQVTLNPMTSTAGAHTFTARTNSSSLNGSNSDQETGNDQTTSSFNIGSGGTGVTLTLDLDCYGSETTWEIRSATNVLMASGGPYVDNSNGEQIVEGLCLAEGCYDFNIFDSYNPPTGDGMHGSQWAPDCTIDGNYVIVSDAGATLVQMTAPNADFGAEANHNFCVGNTTSVTCEELFNFDGAGYEVNDMDEPNFNAFFYDEDDEDVNAGLAAQGVTGSWEFEITETNPADNYSAIVTSYHANTTVPADNWLNFGPLTMPSDGGELTWRHRFFDNANRDGYEILVGTVGIQPADFASATTLFSVGDNDPTTDGDTDWTDHTIDLPAGTYAHQQLYFAIHHNADDMYFLLIDDVIVEGCSSDPLGIEETESMNLMVYPNPSSENFVVRYQNDSGDALTFRMYNTVGQEVWTKSSNASGTSTETIKTDNLSSGVYTLVVQGKNVNASERLILTK